MADLSFYISPLSEEIREEGRVQGRAESILLLLGARGIDVPDATREKITACGDPEQLRQWLRAAAHVTSAEEIFREETSASG
ncbi:hypothetical protein [Streptomyces atroolivaceus]|uniref:Transposase n=1 Tax=Streptomyces atroolivaceus TaxID=66869 RepID=A0ABV9V3J4_STRAZ|nr:hypothetical protein [Streptomyces atroolivaceus]